MQPSKTDPKRRLTLHSVSLNSSFGAVFLAQHKATKSVVAIKKLTIVQDSDEEAIMLEIDIMKECESPYIVTYYGSYINHSNSEIWVRQRFFLVVLEDFENFLCGIAIF